VSKFLSALFSITALPLLLLNILSIVGGAIWLAALGEWKLVAIGILLLLVSSFLLGIVLIPSTFLISPAAYFLEKKVPVGALIFVLLSDLYVVAVMSARCCGMLFLFVNGGDGHDRVPRLLWSYAVAIGPWAYMMSRESGEGSGSVIATLAAIIPYLIVIALVLFTPVSLIDSARVFSVFMLITLVIQTVIGFARLREG